MAYTDIGTKLMGSLDSPPTLQTVTGATTAGLLSEHWIDLLEGLRSQDTIARSIGEGAKNLIANFFVGTGLTAATANVTAMLELVALPRTNLTAINVTAANGTETFTAAAHGLPNGTCLTVGGTQPTGIAANTHYFVINATTDTFQLSADPGGAVAPFSTDGTSVTVTVVPQIIGSSGPIPLKRLGAGMSASVRVNPINVSKQMPRHRYVFARIVPSATLTAGTMGCNLNQDDTNETLFYPSGQIA